VWRRGWAVAQRCQAGIVALVVVQAQLQAQMAKLQEELRAAKVAAAAQRTGGRVTRRGPARGG
jgi:hypothetical protein